MREKHFQSLVIIVSVAEARKSGGGRKGSGGRVGSKNKGSKSKSSSGSKRVGFLGSNTATKAAIAAGVIYGASSWRRRRLYHDNPNRGKIKTNVSLKSRSVNVSPRSTQGQCDPKMKVSPSARSSQSQGKPKVKVSPKPISTPCQGECQPKMKVKINPRSKSALGQTRSNVLFPKLLYWT